MKSGIFNQSWNTGKADCKYTWSIDQVWTKYYFSLSYKVRWACFYCT